MPDYDKNKIKRPLLKCPQCVEKFESPAQHEYHVVTAHKTRT